ncbi:MAG: prepilin-type N-terminal cleavage/methylation domain-containing protein, partial [Verrucomicrobiota bacterium]
MKTHPPSPAARRLQRAGFTLIELLLVLVILGILAAIVVPKFSGRTEQARETAARSQIA